MTQDVAEMVVVYVVPDEKKELTLFSNSSESVLSQLADAMKIAQTVVKKQFPDSLNNIFLLSVDPSQPTEGVKGYLENSNVPYRGNLEDVLRQIADGQEQVCLAEKASGARMSTYTSEISFLASLLLYITNFNQKVA